MPKSISQDRIDRFRREGYLCPVPALTVAEVAHYQACFAAFEAREGGVLEGNARNKSHLFLAWLDELVHHPAVLDVVEDLIGPDILLYHAQWFVKDPHTPHFVSLHQDAAYWGLERPDALTAWISFTASTASQGCMRVIPGTHAVLYDHQNLLHEHNLLWRGQTVDAELDESKAVDLVLEPGEMSIHHARIVHGSGPNISDMRRVGYAARYVRTDVKRIGPRDSAMLVRGVDEHGHFDPEPRPASDYDLAALQVHKDVTDRYMENYLSAQVEKARGQASA
jgi:chlorinating enzyme